MDGRSRKIEKQNDMARRKSYVTILPRSDNNDYRAYEQGNGLRLFIFQTRVCVHTMALEMVLNGMVDKAELSS